MNENAVLLLVDDDTDVLETLEAELEPVFGDDYQIVTAMGAQDAMDIIADIKGDSKDDSKDDSKTTLLILSDWLMPGMKGDEFLIEVYNKWPDIKSMLLTGKANVDSIINAQEKSNMSCFMRKPWKKEELVDAVKTLVIKKTLG